MTAATYEVILPGNALVLAPEARYVTETPTGLAFADDTPLEVWGALVERLTRQHKRIEWAIGDAINFAERAYDGHKYEQWIEETGLSENTLSTMRWVAERIDPLRRRKDVGWSHHREVASLPAPAQDRILEQAADKGMTRWEVRKAAKAEREQLEGHAVSVDGTPLPGDDLEWVPQKDQLTDEARAALEVRLSEMDRKHRVGFEAGWLRALAWADCLGAFKRDGAS